MTGTYSEYHHSTTFCYEVWTRSAINGEWKRQYPKFIAPPMPVTKWKRFLKAIGLGSFPTRSPDSPYLSKVDTVELAKPFVGQHDIQDVEIICEVWDSSGYGEGGEYTVWRNGKWVR